jgi:hypothetical protein
MAYSTANPPALTSQKVGATGGAVWIYKDGDDKAAVTAADYISNGDDLGMVVGDRVIHIDETNSITNDLAVSAVTAGGAATLDDALVQELTETGAVTPGVSSVELNHATVAVAATAADSLDHQGLLVIKNTSASGTAAHTFTFTSGTLDGTNSTATLNAPNEALVVWIDSAGNGTIVENVGTVALS